MPMIRRGNHHRINVFSGDQLTKIHIGPATLEGAALGLIGILLLNAALGVFPSLRVHIAHRHHLAVGLAQKMPQVAAVHLAGANETQTQTRTGGLFAFLRPDRAGDNSGGCGHTGRHFRESAPVQGCHREVTLVGF